MRGQVADPLCRVKTQASRANSRPGRRAADPRFPSAALRTPGQSLPSAASNRRGRANRDRRDAALQLPATGRGRRTSGLRRGRPRALRGWERSPRSPAHCARRGCRARRPERAQADRARSAKWRGRSAQRRPVAAAPTTGPRVQGAAHHRRGARFRPRRRSRRRSVSHADQTVRPIHPLHRHPPPFERSPRARRRAGPRRGRARVVRGHLRSTRAQAAHRADRRRRPNGHARAEAVPGRPQGASLARRARVRASRSTRVRIRRGRSCGARVPAPLAVRGNLRARRPRSRGAPQPAPPRSG